MAGLVPAIHVFLPCQDVDARHKAGHDESIQTEYASATKSFVNQKSLGIP
jgi:hypothetical protein